MPDKRKLSTSSSPERKRARSPFMTGDEHNVDTADRHSIFPVTSQEQPRSDPIYGQKSAFPGLDDVVDELFYGPAEDGMEYLRMVR